MDDPLRPKMVPLAADTILWFEFLLDSRLLLRHLSKPNPLPPPVELINQFISMSPDQAATPLELATPTILENETPATPGSIKPESFRVGRKQLALKILGLKVGTFLKWNLDLLEKSLPIPRQMSLLKDLLCVSFDMVVSVPINEEWLEVYPKGSEKAAKFAYTLYHRWVLRLQITKDIAVKALRPNVADPLQQAIAPDINTGISLHFLRQLCQSDDPFYIFTYDTFTSPHPNTDFSVQNFDDMKEIPISEVKAQVYFDFTNYYLYSKQYQKARESIINCRDNMNAFKKLNVKFMYCTVSENDLNGFLTACGVSGRDVTLSEKFNMSLLNNYEEMIDILKEDNIVREIPVVNRRVLELDVEGAISLGVLTKPKQFLIMISALNVIRSIFDDENIFTPVNYFPKFKFEAIAAINEGVLAILPHCSLSEKCKIKKFFTDFVLRYEKSYPLSYLSATGLFTRIEVEEFQRQNSNQDIVVPALAMQNDWMCSSKIQRIDVGALERQLISCTNSVLVRKLLVKLASTNPSKPLWQVNPSWQIPTPINSVLMSMQRGFLQDFAYVLLGKAREMSSKNDFVGAVSMLSVLKSETQRAEISNTLSIVKLGKLVTWEILLIQICQSLFEWNNKSLDMQSLAVKCKHCLTTVQNVDNVSPRIEIIEHCAIMLLNVNDWNSLMVLDKRITQLDLPISLASTFLEMEKLKGSKKCFRDPWDLILPMFSNSFNKRPNSSSRNSPSLGVPNNFQSFLKRIRDQTVLSLIISLLAKIHNILKDDQHFDLNGEYMHLWPTSISNPVGYNIKAVAEMLNWLLDEGLKYYPYNICWMRLKGDLELANGNNEAAMKNYVNTIITGTENFTLPLQKSIIDDYIVRKMIKCATNMNCYMQSVILCQFLDEIDYGVASKNLSEKWPNFMDAIDSYYNCLWDQTLLEMIIVLHTKKNEFIRRQDATSVLWNSDINPNNNEEIKREAINLRKVRFLRSLANQYLL